VLFIGSSSESLDVAYAAQEDLEIAHKSSFGLNVFDLSRNFLDSLLDTLDETKVGLFVFAPDDLTRIRGHAIETTRDNVIFELGLFIGRLGRERTFIVMPKDIVDLHLPRDLLGVNTASFAKPENPKLLVGALGAACNKVRRAINLVSTSNQEVGDLDLALSRAVPQQEQKHLLNLAEGRTRGYEGRGSLRSELRNLVSMGLVKKLSGRHIGDMKSGMVYDLADFVNLTARGRRWADRIKQQGN
jgi:hypothetical protein